MLGSEKNLTVADAANHLKISSDTIRRWEKKGLLKAGRSAHNHRVFSADELERLARQQAGDSDHGGLTILKNKKKTNLRAIELFSGAGGLALGLEHAGFNADMLVEFARDAADTLRKNRGRRWNVVESDIRNVSFKAYNGKIDLVAGGFPCQAFSYAGHGEGFADSRGTLFYEFARCVSEVEPKVAIAENVRGLLNHDSGRTLRAMVLEMESRNYRVDYRLLRSQFLDVPQKRERLLIIAVRKDLDFPFLFPKERDYTISLREALKDVPDSPGAQYPAAKKKILARIPPGGYWRDLPIDLQRTYLGGSFYLSGGKTGMARRLSWDEPSLTLTCSPAQKQTERCHPKETRPLNVREYARIQTFPDDWEFTGGVSAQYKQIGNAVPVNLGFHIGNAIRGMFEGRWNQKDVVKAEATGADDRKWRLFS